MQDKQRTKIVETQPGSEDVLINIAEAAQLLGLSIDTLRNWDNSGKLKAVRTQGNHRRYRLSKIRKLQGEDI